MVIRKQVSVHARLSRASASIVVAAAMLAAGSASGKPIVAVFNIESKGSHLGRRVLENLGDYLSVSLAESGIYEVIPRSQVKQRLRAQRKESYKACYDTACQIELGQELAAAMSLSTKVMKIGSRCIVTSTLYDLRRATSERAAKAVGGCGEDGIMKSLDEVVAGITGSIASFTKEEGKTEKGGVAGINWVLIPGGTFMMGSNDGDAFKGEKPVHRVRVGTFQMAKTEVTVAQYRACMFAGACTQPNTDKNCNVGKSGRDDHPVNCVDWDQAKAFSKWAGGRLPSEAEWEYAARSGGKNQRYPWGDAKATCRYAVMDDDVEGCGKGHTWRVCSKTMGSTSQYVCDMAGNVWEWVEDCWHKNYRGAPDDGTAWTRGCTDSGRVFRGGSWFLHARRVRAANRTGGFPGIRDDNLGFRPVRSVP